MLLTEAYYKTFNDNQYYPVKIRQILDNQHSTIHIKTMKSGLIILTNGKLIKCVADYYQIPKEVRSNNYAIRCNNIREFLGISQITTCYGCDRCHSICIAKEINHELIRKKDY